MKTEAISIGGKPVVTLERAPGEDENQAQFLEAILLPGRGMSLLQLKAHIPGKGDIGLIDAPPLAEAKQILDHEDDEFGNKVFHISGAILLPFPNRITGTVSPEWQDDSSCSCGEICLLASQLAREESWRASLSHSRLAHAGTVPGCAST
jgi:hypothetical protein